MMTMGDTFVKTDSGGTEFFPVYLDKRFSFCVV